MSVHILNMEGEVWGCLWCGSISNMKCAVCGEHFKTGDRFICKNGLHEHSGIDCSNKKETQSFQLPERVAYLPSPATLL
jgi:hypothetical protein